MVQHRARIADSSAVGLIARRGGPVAGPIVAFLVCLLVLAAPDIPAPLPRDAEWTTYHLDNSRTADDADGATLRGASPAWTRNDLDAPVYAEPLIYQGVVYEVTENDSLYAMSAATGRTLWHLRLAAPAVAPILHCTPIVPLGITSTPVIDPATSRLYTVGVVDTVSRTTRYQTWLFAIDLAAHAVLFHVRVDGPGADIDGYNQRAALTLLGGRVYVPFGGRPGDCGSYHGVITSVRASDGGQLLSFRDTSGDVTGGGFWASGGLAVDDGGDLLAASGNALRHGSFCGAGFELQNSVLRLTPTLATAPADRWTPPNWRQLDCYDDDLGVIVPTLLPGTGLVFQSGKAGWAYLLREWSLGGTAPAPFAVDLGAGECRGGAAFDGQFVFVGCQGGLLALRLEPVAPSLRLPGRGGWRQSASGCDAEPPILAAGVVWWLDRCHVLHASDPTTGHPIFHYDVGSGNHFATPAAALGELFVPTGTGVMAFRMRTA
ncbi:MAG TPA: PQQ-binding-like beta-propeller repeat protein [Candidatus Dormibacteraeota bacterium]|nr:PQQ-binding-like beta-propeller repeat protein [Candidatus Dormibacteraeota bacterium]